MTTGQPRPQHGDLAIIRYTHHSEQRLAQYRDPTGDGDGAHWAYLGTTWTDSPSQVAIVRRVELVEEVA